MLLRQIRYFVTVVECNSFTEAAEQCYISQSAISQQIQTLEGELGVELLKRSGRKFSATPAGESFFQPGQLLLEEASELQRETMRIGHKNHPVLNVGYLSIYSGPEFGLAVAEIAQNHPETDIQVHSGTHEELYEMLLSGRVDLVLSDPRRSFSEEYVNYPIFTGYCYIECAGHGLLAEHTQVTLADLKRRPCILVSSQAQRRTEQDYYEKTLGFTGPFLFAENLEEARRLVIGGKGYLPLLETSNTMPQMGGRVKRIPLYRGERQVQRSYYAFWPQKRDAPLLREFANILKELFGHGEE